MMVVFVGHYRNYPSHYVIHPGYIIVRAPRGGYDVYREWEDKA